MFNTKYNLVIDNVQNIPFTIKFKLRDNVNVNYLVNLTIKLTLYVAKKIPVSIFVSLNSMYIAIVHSCKHIL